MMIRTYKAGNYWCLDLVADTDMPLRIAWDVCVCVCVCVFLCVCVVCVRACTWPLSRHKLVSVGFYLVQ